MFPKYPSTVDDNVVRAVASVTFATLFLITLRPESTWLIYFLALDFILRYLNPNFSPLARLMKWINFSLLKNSPQPKFAPPKRFAILIGVIFTTLMSISLSFNWEVLFLILSIGMLVASGLQSWFNYCIGCTVYDFLVKLHILRRNDHISKLYNSISH